MPRRVLTLRMAVQYSGAVVVTLMKPLSSPSCHAFANYWWWYPCVAEGAVASV
ncbi:MAG TPA: hypothetical protein VIY56_18550 [Vicinamibacterales bacterium]